MFNFVSSAMFILLFYLTFYLNVYGDAQDIYTAAIAQGRMIINVGTPEQRLLGMFSLEVSETLLVDINCGVHMECASYCTDAFFASAYCQTNCQPGNFASESLTRCESFFYNVYKNLLNYDKFYPMNSSSIEFSQTEWSKWISGFAPFYGRIVRDQLSIPTNSTSDDESTFELSVQIEMIDTLLVDSNFMIETTSVIGLAPGERNIVTQMYANGVIPKPIVSMDGVDNDKNNTVTFGAYDLQNCHRWTQHKNVGNRWILDVNNLEINGFQYAVRSKVLLSLYRDYIYIPSDYLDFLVQSKVLIKWDDDGPFSSYRYNCNQQLELNTMIDGQPISLDKQILGSYSINDSLCNTQIYSLTILTPEKRYIQEVDFVFGAPFVQKYCIAFDYQSNTVGLALRNDF
ncbi:hypothetical protein M3Y95_00908300 [Aphelenchoides besseyi]|nr:hypothetical protein M3Y95_00908300 [Aphelenchoides besseyi]